MDSPIVLFLLAVGKHWAEFLIGAVTIGAAVGAVVALVERYRQRSVVMPISLLELSERQIVI